MSQTQAVCTLEDWVSDYSLSVQGQLSDMFNEEELTDELIRMVHDIAGEEIRQWYLLFKRKNLV